MCGIVAAVSPAANIVSVPLEGLRKLAYCGRDLYALADADSHFPETEQIHVLRPPEHHGGL